MFDWKNTVITVSGGRNIPMEMFRQLILEKALFKQKTVSVYDKTGHGNLEKVTRILSELINSRLLLENKFHNDGKFTFYISDDTFYFVSQDGMPEGKENVAIQIYLETLDEELVDKLENTFSDLISSKPPQGQVMMLAREGNLYLTSLGRISNPLVRENYTDNVIKSYEEILEDFKGDNPSGRLVILDGPPGSGKSYFIRGLITEADALFVFIPSSIMGEITGPDIIPVLLQERFREIPIVLIIEDADSSLATRQMDNVNKLSDILNISDGILGDLSDIRILATTNQKCVDIDPAALRAGRLSHHITLTHLTPEKAEKIYSNLTKNDKGEIFTKDVTLADVYKLARKNGWKPEPRKTSPKRGSRIGSNYSSIREQLGVM